ncbi:hypothetical protein LOZ53_003344 [Ophidiomyces ophidiicola]|nr:hypothetical protein LOZ55_002412 [Ophidiomyces ophidiicola]KAI1990091.1 hypothetical protein LOZ53_003344 [Ophidiomyces ophidiicola]KAI1992294.1 hypothetical protein LOZ54_001775 [Ophidiomyces ophidiicola]KAI1993616.1 hypothetical protein LOZ51_003995 [Ophidiomyces ophidiicola]
MICSRCRMHILSRLPFYSPVSSILSPSRITSGSQLRTYSTPADATQKQAQKDGNEITTTPSTKNAKTSMKVESSVPAGTRLLGLNYLKNKPDIIALDDAEYPDWLWRILDDTNDRSGSGAGNVDLSSLNRKQRKRHEKKAAVAAASKPRVIPLHEQAIDIVSVNAVTADAENNFEVASTGIDTRKSITKSARAARRKSIKESNFLKGL